METIHYIDDSFVFVSLLQHYLWNLAEDILIADHIEIDFEVNVKIWIIFENSLVWWINYYRDLIKIRLYQCVL